jgi:hypothetical protein
MQEVLSKPGYESLALSEQELYELRLDDFSESWRPGFVVTESYMRWSEIDRQFMSIESETERLPTLEEAKGRYEARREALTKKGFTQSDLDPVL